MRTINIITVLLITIILVACVQVAKEVPTETVIPTITLTAVPTEIPPTQTETPDPNAPEGWTRHENGIYYLDKTENGKTIAYTVIQEVNTWGRDLGIFPLMDYTDADLIPNEVIVALNVPGADGLESLTHTYSESGATTEIGDHFMSTFSAELYKRHFHKDAIQLTQDEMLQYRLSILSGNAVLPYITSQGQTAEGKLSTKSGFKTIIVDPKTLESKIGNGVSKWQDADGFVFYSETLAPDAQGNIIGVIASVTPLNELPDWQIREMALFFPGFLISKEDQTVQFSTDIVYIFTKYASASEPIPYFDIVRNP